MKKLSGKVIFRGIAQGPIHVVSAKCPSVRRVKVTDVENEIRRTRAAKKKIKEELDALYEKALREAGESNADIFRAHQMLLEDEDYQKSVENIICSLQVNAEYAVAEVGDNWFRKFADMDDPYMQARTVDIRDITEKLIKKLCNYKEEQEEFVEPVIIVANDLTPGEAMALDKSRILAFVLRQGSVNSHTAILAKSMNIPALTGVDISISELENGVPALVNGYTGEFILEPSEEQIREAENQIKEETEKKALLQSMKGKENITMSGKRISLYANIGSIDELSLVMENDAAGVGLFRSEFLYIGRSELPDEEEQFYIYKKAAQILAGKKLIVRTLDIGADKQLDYLQLEKEDNPALGLRGIRVSLAKPDIFRTQLKALYRAAVYGNISILYPMIISTGEVLAIRQIAEEVKEELAIGNIPYKDVEEGIMIETPAAAMISDKLAELVDFFSIGTNDLTQYTLAIDRQNSKLEPFYNSRHNAILKMIKMVTENAHKAGIRVAICGELGADPNLTETFVEMGIDELSVPPTAILQLREIIRRI